MDNVREHLSKLGLRVRDKVTKFEGIITTVGFDLYGCVQAIINPGLDKDGKPRDGVWLDISRVEVLDAKPVMAQPNYDYGPVAEGRHGPAEKPGAGQL